MQHISLNIDNPIMYLNLDKNYICAGKEFVFGDKK